MGCFGWKGSRRRQVADRRTVNRLLHECRRTERKEGRETGKVRTLSSTSVRSDSFPSSTFRPAAFSSPPATFS